MRTFILTCIALLFMGHVNAQSIADSELAEMLNSGDMLRLNTRYPQIKDSLQVPMLARLAETNLYIHFNQLEKAEKAMADLFTNHQQELDAQTQIGMSALRAMNFLNLGQYATAGELGGTLVSALEPQVPFEELYSLVFIERMGKALAHYPTPSFSRPTGKSTRSLSDALLLPPHNYTTCSDAYRLCRTRATSVNPGSSQWHHKRFYLRHGMFFR